MGYALARLLQSGMYAMKIYTPGEIEGGQVATITGVEQVLFHLRSRLHHNEDVLVAQLFGSCAYGTHNSFSDVDVVIVPDAKRFGRVMHICVELGDVASLHNVPLNIELLPYRLASRGTHSLWGIYDHIERLAATERGVIRGIFSSVVKPCQCSFEEEVRRYAAFKHRQMLLAQLAVGGGRASSTDVAKWLQDALDLPGHLLRKVLLLRNRLPGDDSQTTILQVLADPIYARSRWMGGFTTLGRLAKEYRALMSECAAIRWGKQASNDYQREFFNKRHSCYLYATAAHMVEQCIVEFF